MQMVVCASADFGGERLRHRCVSSRELTQYSREVWVLLTSKARAHIVAATGGAVSRTIRVNRSIGRLPGDFIAVQSIDTMLWFQQIPP